MTESPWPLRTIGELAAKEPNSITDGPFGSKLKTVHYTASGPRVVRLANIGDGVFIDAKAHISDEHFATLQKHRVFPGDLVFAALGENPPRSCLVPDDLGPAIVKADCIRFKPGPLLSPKFANYALNSNFTRQKLKGTIHGVGRPRLNLTEIKGIAIPVPPLGEQRRIVAEIEKQFTWLEAAVTTLTRVRANATRYRRALLAAAYSDLNSPFRRLDEIASITGGLTKNQRRENLKRRLPYLRVANVYHGELHLDNIAYIGVHDREIEKLLLRRGDLLVVEGNGSKDQIGRVAVWNGSIDPCLHQNHLIKVRPTTQLVRSEWIALWLQSPRGRQEIERVASSTSGLYTLSIRKVAGLVVPVPAVAVQDAIVRDVEQRMSFVERMDQVVGTSLVRAKNLRQSILLRAFSGQL